MARACAKVTPAQSALQTRVPHRSLSARAAAYSDRMTTRRNALALLGAGTIALRAAGYARAADSRAAPEPGLALGRLHTDFIQSQNVAARVLNASNSQPGVSGAPLSYDAKGTRAVSVLFKYPADWSMPRPHYVNSDQEFLVLDGSLDFDGVVYGAGDYAYLPAGKQHEMMRSPTGATVLNFYEGEHLAFYAPTPEGMFRPEKLVLRIASDSLPWKRASDPGSLALGADVKEKLLRYDARSGERTWLVQVGADPPGRDPKRAVVVHETVEEMFLLSGTVATPLGLMQSGAYVWRSPGTPRGPFGSRTGFTALLRSKGGALNTKIVSASAPINWAAAPLLP